MFSFWSYVVTFLLKGALKEHFNKICVSRELIENIRNNMYADDLVSGGNNLSEVEVIKQKSMELLAKGGFSLHKWRSNISLLEKSDSNNNDELTYVIQLFSNNTSNTKILGLVWNKTFDTLFLIIPTYQQKAITKRNILSYVGLIH